MKTLKNWEPMSIPLLVQKSNIQVEEKHETLEN
jgi:hypothetical protein